jgi:hypothetical protein
VRAGLDWNARLVESLSRSETSSPSSRHFLLLLFAGWVNRHQNQVIDCLMEENRVLRGQIGGRRLRLTDHERRRRAGVDPCSSPSSCRGPCDNAGIQFDSFFAPDEVAEIERRHGVHVKIKADSSCHVEHFEVRGR